MHLYGYGRKIESIFQLLGNHENDITKAIAYTLSKNSMFLNNFLDEILDEYTLERICLDDVIINFQQYYEKNGEDKNNGITDVEIYQEPFFKIIIEAKKYDILPNISQLKKYAYYLNQIISEQKLILTMSDFNSNAADIIQENDIDGIRIKHITYKKVYEIAKTSLNKSKNEERRILKELISFLEGVIFMSNEHSSVVYVVPLNGDSVKKHDEERIYTCPVGNGFLKKPENYLGFRFGGKLQYINHVDKVEYYRDGNKRLMFKFILGPDIIPKEIVKSGPLRDTKLFCDIDLLLTSSSIKEAYTKYKSRK